MWFLVTKKLVIVDFSMTNIFGHLWLKKSILVKAKTMTKNLIHNLKHMCTCKSIQVVGHIKMLMILKLRSCFVYNILANHRRDLEQPLVVDFNFSDKLRWVCSQFTPERKFMLDKIQKQL